MAQRRQHGLILLEKRGSKARGGLVRDLDPGPLAPEARIIPLDQRAIGCSCDWQMQKEGSQGREDYFTNPPS